MTPSSRASSLPIVLGRVFWMMLGPMILAVAAMLIVTQGEGWFTTPDFIFLAVLIGLVAARWVEFWAGEPQTSTGEPAKPDDFRRYARGTIVLGLVAWIVANLLGNHWPF